MLEIIHSQGSHCQYKPYAVSGIPVGGKQVQNTLVAEVDGCCGGGKRQAVRINNALSGSSARCKAAGIQFQRHRLARHVQSTGNACKPGVILHDDGADHGAGQAAQIDGIQGSLRSGGSGHFHVSGGFGFRVFQASLRNQNNVGRIQRGQIENTVIDGDPSGPQGVSPRQGDGARSGERRGTGEPGVAGRQRYLSSSVNNQGTSSEEGPGPDTSVTQPRRSAARNGECAQEGVRSGEFQRSGVYGYRAAGRTADDASVGEIAGKGQRGIVLDVNAVPQLGHIGGIHGNRAAVHLELTVQVDAARQGNIARSLGGERRSAQIAAEGEILGGKDLVARKDNVIGKRSSGCSVPFRTDVGIRKFQDAVRPHRYVIQLEIAGRHGQDPLKFRAHIQDIGPIAGSQSHGNGTGTGGIQVQSRVIISPADRQYGTVRQFHGFSIGQSLGDGGGHFLAQRHGTARPRHVVCGKRRGKRAGSQIEAAALQVDHAHSRLNVRRSQSEHAVRNGNGSGSQGIGDLGYQFALLDGNIPVPARVVQIKDQLPFAALGQRSLGDFSGAVGNEDIIAAGSIVNCDGSRIHRSGQGDGSRPGTVEDQILPGSRIRGTFNAPHGARVRIAPGHSFRSLPDPHVPGGSHYQLEGCSRLLQFINQRFVPGISGPVKDGAGGIKTAGGGNQGIFPGIRNAFKPVQRKIERSGPKSAAHFEGGADIQCQRRVGRQVQGARSRHPRIGRHRDIP